MLKLQLFCASSVRQHADRYFIAPSQTGLLHVLAKVFDKLVATHVTHTSSHEPIQVIGAQAQVITVA
jgi:hypothetical protein